MTTTDDESTAKIDIAAMTEAIRQSAKDLDAEVERINAAREALPPPIDRAAQRRAAKQASSEAGSRTADGAGLRARGEQD